MELWALVSELARETVELYRTREEVEHLLIDGFLPRVDLDAKPAARRSGFQEFGLPYAPDAAITRYLAAFLWAHRGIEAGAEEPKGRAAAHHPVSRERRRHAAIRSVR